MNQDYGVMNQDFEISLVKYRDEKSHLEIITSLIQDELSEPYIIYTYRYFLNQWPHLCYLAYATPKNPPEDYISSSKTIQDLIVSELEGEETDQEEKREQPDSIPIGVVVSKLDRHLKGERLMRGYIAMLSVDSNWRRRGVASLLVRATLKSMIGTGAQEVVLETEVDNSSSLALYEHLGFIKEKRLYRFYLNGKDCFRLVLPIPSASPPTKVAPFLQQSSSQENTLDRSES